MLGPLYIVVPSSYTTRLHPISQGEEVSDVIDVVGVVDVDQVELARPRLGHTHLGAGGLPLAYRVVTLDLQRHVRVTSSTIHIQA